MDELEDRVCELEERVDALEAALRAEYGDAWHAYIQRENE